MENTSSYISDMYPESTIQDESDESINIEEESEEQKNRRASIRAIMTDPSLTPFERRKSIQNLMDGRRRSSQVLHTRNSMINGLSGGVGDDFRRSSNGAGLGLGAAAAEVAKWFEDDSYEDCSEDGDGVDNVNGDGNFSRRSSRRSSGRRRSSELRTGELGDVLEDEVLEEGNTNEVFDIEPPENADEEWYQCMRMERHRPECNHYERNCTIISPCCGQAFGCRICHDECPILPPPFFLRKDQKQCVKTDEHNPMDNTYVHQEKEDKNEETETAAPATTAARRTFSDEVMKHDPIIGFDSHRRVSLPSIFSKSLAITDEDEDFHHAIDRFAIKEVICRKCCVRQSSKTNNCINCGIQFGKYHCNICNLWMPDDESPYHCDECGFCRVGGSDNFKHCMDCGMCIDVELFHDHNCKSGKYMSNCPVCQEDLFSSRDASHEMPCGHAIHWHCFEELTSFDSRCPICKKTAETPEQMAPTWQAMAMSIAIQPVPLELTKVVAITCNDCEEEDTNRRWHFLGVQCKFCSSFNTNVDEILMVGQDAVDFLGIDDQELERARSAFAAVMEGNEEDDDGEDGDDEDLHDYYHYNEQQQSGQSFSGTNAFNPNYVDDTNAAQYNLQQFLMTANNNEMSDDEYQSENED